MSHRLLHKLKAWDQNPKIAPRVVLISGTGGKAFSVGGDIVSIYKSVMGLPGSYPNFVIE